MTQVITLLQTKALTTEERLKLIHFLNSQDKDCKSLEQTSILSPDLIRQMYNPEIKLRETDNFKIYKILQKEADDIKQEILAVAVLVLQSIDSEESGSSGKRALVGRRLKKMLNQLPLVTEEETPDVEGSLQLKLLDLHDYYLNKMHNLEFAEVTEGFVPQTQNGIMTIVQLIY